MDCGTLKNALGALETVTVLASRCALESPFLNNGNTHRVPQAPALRRGSRSPADLSERRLLDDTRQVHILRREKKLQEPNIDILAFS